MCYTISFMLKSEHFNKTPLVPFEKLTIKQLSEKKRKILDSCARNINCLPLRF